MQKISKLLLPSSKRIVFQTAVRPFSIQTDMSSFDFSDKLNIEELKLKNP